MMDTALRAGPFAYGQRKLRQFEAAARAAFRGREESVDSDKMLSGHCCLVLAHTHELAPAGIGYRLCQMVVLQHVLNLQALKDQRLVFVHHSVRGLMLEVAALTGHTPVQLRQTCVSSDMRVDPSDDIRTDPPISRFMQVYCS